MLRLAVATAEETYERLGDPLAARDVEVVGISASERTFSLSPSLPAVDVGFVFPHRLPEGGAVDAHLDVPWVNDREAVLTSRNKAEVLARLDAAGLPVPETVFVSNPADEADLVAAYEHIDGPVVVKPNSATRGTGVARAADLDSFLGICDYLGLLHEYPATRDRSFLVQEFLPDARDYRAMIVDGRYVGAVERRLPADAAEGRWKHNVHRGATAVGVELPDDRRRLAERVADTLEIPWLGVDFLVAPDGEAKVSETNARPTIDDPTKYVTGFWDELVGLIRQTAAEE